MDVILVKDVKGLGRAGQVVKVSDGQARNQLFPSGAAVAASAESLRRLKEKQDAEARRVKNVRHDAEQLARRLGGYKLVLKEAATPAGNLYAAVTAHRLAQALKGAGFDVPDIALVSFKPLKQAGTATAEARLAPGAVARFTVVVEPSP